MSDDRTGEFSSSCPTPVADRSTIQLAHGGGGRLMRSLIEGMFLPAFRAGGDASPQAAPPHDSTVVEMGGLRVEMGELRVELKTEMNELRTDIAKISYDLASFQRTMMLMLIGFALTIWVSVLVA